jgi:hypothetical protein
MDDLAQLQSRVEAARERLGGAEADQRKYGLRLDDLVRIVEGALSRQAEDLKAARIRSASLETELDDARNAIARSEVELAGKETDIARLESQNEQLRAMVMTLLELVEGRNTTPLREAMLRLERGVRSLLTETGSARAILNAPAETPAAPPPPAPARPVLVQPQAVPGRVQTPRAKPEPQMQPQGQPLAQPLAQPPAQPPADSDALVELTSLERGDPEEIVKQPPEISAPVAQIIRRLSDAAVSDA